MIQIDILSDTFPDACSDARLEQAAMAIFQEALVECATLNIAIVDDPTIHGLNRQFLDHDYPTDVLSFLLERDGGSLEGEVIVSPDTAPAGPREFGWSAADELLLYVIHGTLHLVGYDDQAEAAARRNAGGRATVSGHLRLSSRANRRQSDASRGPVGRLMHFRRSFVQFLHRLLSLE